MVGERRLPTEPDEGGRSGLSAPPPSQTGQADLPHPAFQPWLPMEVATRGGQCARMTPASRAGLRPAHPARAGRSTVGWGSDTKPGALAGNPVLLTPMATLRGWGRKRWRSGARARGLAVCGITREAKPRGECGGRLGALSRFRGLGLRQLGAGL